MNDYDTAYFYAVHTQEEIARFLYFAEKGCHLKFKGVEINRFQDIEQFEAFLRENTASSLS
jgi:hypothetical protein